VGFVYTSWYEGFGLPVLEAMASGCRVIASRIPSTVETAGDVPVYFDPADAESLITALDLTWLEYSSANIHRVDHGISQAAGYSWDLTAQRTLQVYRNLVAAL
jgi:alpha-1,3-rhamnosyl/mannosyltransferase